MTNNKQQTEINAVEYLGKVNQFAKENSTDKPRQQTAVEWLLNAIETKNGEEFSSYYTEFIEQAKEMEKEMTIKLYADYENYLEEAFKNQCGGQAVVLSFEEFYEQTYGGGEQ